ncbi:MAG: 6-bladed beta-propeller [Candidatus Longimicrobiales bacterium M2_2A_002]
MFPQKALSASLLFATSLVAGEAYSGTQSRDAVWHLEPLATVGVTEGDERYVFGRIADLALGPDGRIYVLDAQAANLRIFAADGTYISTVGRKGAGPGEFAVPYSIAFDEHDRLWVADAGNARYSVFDLEGSFLNSYPIPFPRSLVPGQSRFTRDGRLLEVAQLMAVIQGADGSVRMRSLGPAAIAMSQGDSLATTDTLPLVAAAEPPAFVRTTGTQTVRMVPPFSPAQLFELDPRGWVWVGHSDRYVVEALSLGGEVVQTLSRDLAAEPLARGDRHSLEVWAADMRSRRYRGSDSQLPGTYPYFDRIIAADDGHVWLHRQGSGGSSFDVFDPAGRHVAEVEAPGNAGRFGTHPHITERFVLLASTDPLGAPVVELYSIEH